MSYFSKSTWASFASSQGLDARLTKAIPRLKIENPTTVQEKSFPAILSGKDVLIKSPTGTGKSLAYIIPLIQRLISREESIKPLSLVILVPSKELTGQVFGVCSSLLHYLFDVVSVDCYSGEGKYRRPSLPSVFITTPRGLVSLCAGPSGMAARENIRFIAVDEADLVLSHGFEKDIRAVVSSVLPKDYQAVLVSATLTDDLETLKGLMLRNPLSVLVNDKDICDTPKQAEGLKTPQPTKGLKQLYFPCPVREKYLCLYGLVKLEVVGGKILIFTSSIDSAYKVKLFFDRFAIRSAVFNSEMPIECRNTVLAAYRDGLFKILIASEESKISDPESAAHRGIDFTNVSAVVNFDLPTTVQSYVHRAGRTARGGKSGVVVSFVDFSNPREAHLIAQVQQDRDVTDIGIPVAAFEPLRYRCEDVYKGISRRAIAATRQKELLSEILHNDQLKQKLSENSDDVQALRQAMRTLREHSKVKWHLTEIPEYLLPDLKGVKPVTEQGGEDVITRFARKTKREEKENKVGRKKPRLREKMLRRDPKQDDESAAPDELAPISGRKLWKVRHHKRTTRKGDNLGKPPRVARRLWKSAKKFT